MKEEEKKKGESLTEYVSRLRMLADTDRVRIHKDYHDEHGNIIVKPIIPYAVDAGGTPQATVTQGAVTTKVYYPMQDGAGVDTTSDISSLTTTATALDTLATGAQTVGWINDVYLVEIVCSALAANRQATLYLYDGTSSITLWASGAAALATGEIFQIWPVDVSTLVTGAVDVIGQPPLPLTSGVYFRLVAVGLTAAETIQILYHGLSKEVGGL